ncbi:histamine N-methyltransferase-like [Ptychodera flava]|uniref:histamine N-methyltransferase-like n=1 Tax=Ptychodera flava TaxID=63121 RepID=UPI003969BCAA
MAQTVKSLMDYPSEYLERINLVHQKGYHTTDDNRLLIYKDTFKELMVRQDSTLCVLLVGSAESNFIDALSLLGKNQPIHFVIQQSSEKAINEFKDLAESKRDQGLWKTVTFDFQELTLDAYLLEAKVAEKQIHFDIIHCYHSAYFFPEPGQVFVDLYNLLNERGILLNTMCAGPWERLYIKVAEYFPSLVHELYGSPHLQGILRQRIPGVEMRVATRELSVDIEECFQKNSKVGNMLLDFLVQGLNFRQNAQEDVADKIIEFIEEKCCRIVNGKRCFIADEEDVYILKKK